ncbi:MAG: hypothetical protein J5974_00475, partial [Pyramidobacter sp.]|nr:hypothetical protein [Pyramidobacter sp.]
NVNALQPDKTERPQVQTYQPIEQRIVDYIKTHGSATRAKVQKAFNLSQSVAGKQLRKLVEQGALEKKGAAKNTVYCMIEPK